MGLDTSKDYYSKGVKYEKIDKNKSIKYFYKELDIRCNSSDFDKMSRLRAYFKLYELTDDKLKLVNYINDTHTKLYVSFLKTMDFDEFKIPYNFNALEFYLKNTNFNLELINLYMFSKRYKDAIELAINHPQEHAQSIYRFLILEQMFLENPKEAQYILNYITSYYIYVYKEISLEKWKIITRIEDKKYTDKKEYSPAKVAEIVASIDPIYSKYAMDLYKNKIDGDMLSKATVEDLKIIVSNGLHARKILDIFKMN